MSKSRKGNDAVDHEYVKACSELDYMIKTVRTKARHLHINMKSEGKRNLNDANAQKCLEAMRDSMFVCLDVVYVTHRIEFELAERRRISARQNTVIKGRQRKRKSKKSSNGQFGLIGDLS